MSCRPDRDVAHRKGVACNIRLALEVRVEQCHGAVRFARVGLDRGRVALSGGLDDLRASYRRVQIVFADAAPDPAFRTPGVVRVAKNHRVLNVIVSGGAEALIDEARGLRPVSVDCSPLTLKDVFLETVAEED